MRALSVITALTVRWYMSRGTSHDGQDLMSYNISFEHQCHIIKIMEDGAYQRDPMERLRSYGEALDKADRILDTEIFEGRECVGFEINDDIRAAKEAEEKGSMIYADVPAGLRDEVVDALKRVQTAAYWERFGFTREGRWIFSGGNKVCISPYAWREDVSKRGRYYWHC